MEQESIASMIALLHTRIKFGEVRDSDDMNGDTKAGYLNNGMSRLDT
jgi:hypothetical protein